MAELQNQTTKYIEELLETTKERLENFKASYRINEANMNRAKKYIQKTNNNITRLKNELKRR